MENNIEHVIQCGYLILSQPSLEEAYERRTFNYDLPHPAIDKNGNFAYEFDQVKKYDSLREVYKDIVSNKYGLNNIVLRYKIIMDGIVDEEFKELEKQLKIEKALSKLTDEEKELLGLK